MMARARALPDVITRFKVDYSELTKAEKASARLHGEFQKGAAKSTTHSLRFTQSLTTMLGHFAKLPPVVDTAARSMESMGSQGVGTMTLLGGAAVAAVGIVAAGLAESLSKYQQMGDAVRTFSQVSGASAEQSSRMVYAFNALGVSEETAAGGMYKLSKAIETTPAKLAALSIEVAHGSDGNVDLEKTLGNVADAYNNETDAARRNLILQTAFGKTGRDMIPILKQGSTALRELEQAAGLVFSAADLERLRQMEIHNREVKASWDEMIASIGQQLVPAVDAVSSEYLREQYAAKKLQEALDAGKISTFDFANAQSFGLGPGQDVVNQARAEYDAAQKVKEAFDEKTDATKKAAAADLAAAQDAQKLIDTMYAQVDAGFALKLANLDVKESADKVKQAQKDYTAAVKEYGANSPQARRAYDDITRASIDQEKAYLAAAAAARKLTLDTDKAANANDDGSHASQVYVDKLQAEADALAPNAPLRKRLLEYIATLGIIPTSKQTEITAHYVITESHGIGARNTSGAGSKHAAVGGSFMAGQDVVVGEYGPERVRFLQPGTVYPHGTTPPAAAAGASGPTFNNTFNQVKADPWDIATELHWLAKTRRF